jgi:hypothetical protein
MLTPVGSPMLPPATPVAGGSETATWPRRSSCYRQWTFSVSPADVVQLLIRQHDRILGRVSQGDQ